VGEQLGFEAFYAATYRRVVGQVFALLNDLQEAEDVTQNAFAKASFHWQHIATYDQPEAWVRRVAFNEAYNSTRRARRWLAALARHGPPPPVPAVSPDRVDLHRALQRLSPRHREVLVLHYVAELPVDEVARQLRLPAGTVKSRLSRARRALADEVGDEREGVTNA
jgi:RNA polymerase sigma-70 factor (ECF subfamily)